VSSIISRIAVKVGSGLTVRVMEAFHCWLRADHRVHEDGQVVRGMELKRVIEL